MRKLFLSLAFTTAMATSAAASGSGHEHGGHANMAEGVHATGEVHAITDKTVNVSHDPIPSIGWPAMRMDLPLLEGADIDGVSEGDKVMIMLEKGPDGMYGVRALERSE
ncbi:copper-binding protein [Tepidamorphus sp. 3E244]|uniref:copper-binding protein n=1 Tax=Tepidamorphus sp. 3E244 TaxID=3385498 RepID=UPI0038FCE280